MRKFALIALAGAASIGLAACGDREADTNKADENATTAGEGEGTGSDGGNASGGNATTASADWPKGARIVEEKGVTYRVDADGTRVELPDTRVVIEDGVRYRVRNGTRVRIDDRGLDVDVDLPDVTPDVDVGINKKGNPDIDVKTDGDGNDGPN